MTAPALALIALLAVILPALGKAIPQAAYDQLNHQQLEQMQ